MKRHPHRAAMIGGRRSLKHRFVSISFPPFVQRGGGHGHQAKVIIPFPPLPLEMVTGVFHRADLRIRRSEEAADTEIGPMKNKTQSRGILIIPLQDETS
jgi:hypothetical protein